MNNLLNITKWNDVFQSYTTNNDNLKSILMAASYPQRHLIRQECVIKDSNYKAIYIQPSSLLLDYFTNRLMGDSGIWNIRIEKNVLGEYVLFAKVDGGISTAVTSLPFSPIQED